MIPFYLYKAFPLPRRKSHIPLSQPYYFYSKNVGGKEDFG